MAPQRQVGRTPLYDTLAAFDESFHTLSFWYEPDSPVSILCDILVVFTESPILWGHVARYRDEHADPTRFEIDFYRGGQTEFLWNDDRLTDQALNELPVAWNALSAMRERNGPTGRYSNALRQFQFAWRSPYLEDICLHLDLALRFLAGSEAVVQNDEGVATIVSSWLGDRGDKAAETVRRLLGVRTKMIARGIADSGEVAELTPLAFRLEV